jgi:DnaJ-class molecular chaperone
MVEDRAEVVGGVVWMICGVCDGAEGWTNDDDWEECPACEGLGMWVVENDGESDGG